MKRGDIYLIESSNKGVSIIYIVDTSKKYTIFVDQEDLNKTRQLPTDDLKAMIINSLGHSRIHGFNEGDPILSLLNNSKSEKGVFLRKINNNKALIVIVNRAGPYEEKIEVVKRDIRFITYNLSVISSGLFSIKLKREIKGKENIRAWKVYSTDRFNIYVTDKRKTFKEKVSKKDFHKCIIPRLKKEGKIIPKTGDTVIIKKNCKQRGVLKGDIGIVLEAIIQQGKRYLTSSKILIRLLPSEREVTVLLKHLKPRYETNKEKENNKIQDSAKIQTEEPQGIEEAIQPGINQRWANWVP